MKSFLLCSGLTGLALLNACATDASSPGAEVDPEAAPSAFAITLSEQDANAVLELVSYPGSDIGVLDDDVGLDVRAARNIAAHRAGPDGISPSADDDVFDDIAELDGV